MGTLAVRVFFSANAAALLPVGDAAIATAPVWMALAARSAGLDFRRFLSSERRVRPRFMIAGVASAVLFLCVYCAVTIAVPAFLFGWKFRAANDVDTVWLIVLVAIAPAQSFAEEVLFRGVLLKIMSVIVGRIYFVVPATSFIFAVGHGGGIQDFVMAFAFGIATAAIAHRFEGLEFGIALHAASNIALILGAQVLETTGGAQAVAIAMLIAILTGLGAWVTSSMLLGARVERSMTDNWPHA